MPINAQQLLDFPAEEITHTYTARDSMLYALGVGLGADPMDEAQLPFVYEKNLSALPTLPVVLGTPTIVSENSDFGIDWHHVVHGEEFLTLHAPPPAAGTVRARIRFTGVSDKGAGKGALLAYERVISDASSGAPLATVQSTLFCRGDGGYARTPGEANAGTAPPARHSVPDAPPDHVVDLATLPQAALIYRLSGDYTTFHADPGAARQAGFDRPILHGLCSFGVAGHAILRALCGYDPARLKSIAVRFSSFVYPGETLSVELWRRGAEVSFRAWVRARNAKVLDNGRALLG